MADLLSRLRACTTPEAAADLLAALSRAEVAELLAAVRETTEPVAWAWRNRDGEVYTRPTYDELPDVVKRDADPFPLYAHPAPRGRVVVTEAMVEAARTAYADSKRTRLNITDGHEWPNSWPEWMRPGMCEDMRAAIAAALALVDADAPEVAEEFPNATALAAWLAAQPRTTHAPFGAALTEAAASVLAERARQRTAEGWTEAHDDAHTESELAAAAACYALPAWRHPSYPPSIWPWDRAWWKPSPDDRRRELVKAGALILAEIERLDRAAALALVDADAPEVCSECDGEGVTAEAVCCGSGFGNECCGCPDQHVVPCSKGCRAKDAPEVDRG